MKEVDGATGEGGGQIFRMALALSALTGEEVRITNIRAGRSKSGLARQHLTAARAVASLCHGSVEGLSLGSSELIFRPGPLTGGSLDLDVGTAGSVTLVLQACILPASLAKGPSALRIRGGTDVRWSPPSDYFTSVFLAMLLRMGVGAEMRVLRRGYYPKGGGIVEANVRPASRIEPLVLKDRGRVAQIGGRAHVSNLPGHISERMKKSAIRHLRGLAEVDIEVAVYDEAAATGPGGALVLWAASEETILGSSTLAEKGVRAEEIGEKTAEGLRTDLESKATLDVHAADQLLPYMALAGGRSTFLVREISGHLRTMLWLLAEYLDVKFKEKELDGAFRVDVEPSHT